MNSPKSPDDLAHSIGLGVEHLRLGVETLIQVLLYRLNPLSESLKQMRSDVDRLGERLEALEEAREEAVTDASQDVMTKVPDAYLEEKIRLQYSTMMNARALLDLLEDQQAQKVFAFASDVAEANLLSRRLRPEGLAPTPATFQYAMQHEGRRNLVFELLPRGVVCVSQDETFTEDWDDVFHEEEWAEAIEMANKARAGHAHESFIPCVTLDAQQKTSCFFYSRPAHRFHPITDPASCEWVVGRLVMELVSPAPEPDAPKEPTRVLPEAPTSEPSSIRLTDVIKLLKANEQEFDEAYLFACNLREAIDIVNHNAKPWVSVFSQGFTFHSDGLYRATFTGRNGVVRVEKDKGPCEGMLDPRRITEEIQRSMALTDEHLSSFRRPCLLVKRRPPAASLNSFVFDSSLHSFVRPSLHSDLLRQQWDDISMQLFDQRLWIETDASKEPALILYKNHRGETAWRRIIPHEIQFKETPWHPPQWILQAMDLDKQEARSFAVANILEWRSK